MKPHEELQDRLVVWRPELGKLLFVSHQWTSWHHADHTGEQLAKLKSVFLDPERTKSMLARDLFDGTHFTSEQATQQAVCEVLFPGRDSRTYVWLDFWSIPQEDRAAKLRSIESIPAYVESADCMLSLVPPVVHADTGALCDATSYNTRGWCRLEKLAYQLKEYKVGYFGAHVIFTGDKFLRATPGQMTCPAESTFNGNFSCCRMGHVLPSGDSIPCDKQAILPVLMTLHTTRLEALRETDLATWRKISALKWSIFDGAPQDAPRATLYTELASVEDFLAAYRFSDINEKAELDMTPLHYASYQNSAPLIHLLVEAKADLEAKDVAPEGIPAARGGCTPLICACINGCDEAVAALLSAKADVNNPMHSQGTPLFVAASIGGRPLVTIPLLLAARADLEAATSECASLKGCTPLLATAYMNRSRVARLLLEARADAGARVACGPHGGQRAVQLAQERGHGYILAVLAEHVGANAPL